MMTAKNSISTTKPTSPSSFPPLSTQPNYVPTPSTTLGELCKQAEEATPASTASNSPKP
ncbi:hypothetical protein Scep_001923 [Stephania cephalantha]|uniref:Uncharacterized protein n=1 Tax=Stephania cephalantha TaxID=152367 RepID=A0AAP0Q3V0_9MAGN